MSKSAINARHEADVVALRDLSRCAAEILDWRRTGQLADGALTREVAAVWERAGDVLPEQQAENTIIALALRQVAARAQSLKERQCAFRLS